jgi:hypothetical protein
MGRGFARAMVVLAVLVGPARGEPSTDCVAASARLLAFVIAEAKGTRHEAQIAQSIAAKGEASVRAAFAKTIAPDQCAFLLIAPDSTLRAIAIASLPERNGQ